MRKKFIIVLLSITAIIACAFGISACGDSVDSGNSNQTGQGESSGNNTQTHEHSYSEIIIVPTCTEQGYTLYSCACGESYKDNYTKTLAHNLHYYEKQDATCTENGNIEYWYCPDCGKKFSDDKALNDLVNIGVIATGHKYGDWTVSTPATCTENGEEIRVCLNDKNHIERQELDMLGHKYGDWTVSTPATCTENGEEIRVCLNDNSHIERQTINMLEHNYVNYVCLYCGEMEPEAPDTEGLAFEAIEKDDEIISYSVIGIGSVTATFVKIPSTFKDKPVAAISNSAFNNCSFITHLIVPDSVETIGYGALTGCSNLESVTLPFVGNSVKSSNESYQYPFGYIFGSTSYSGGIKTSQQYMGHSYGNGAFTATNNTYYIPNKLKNVKITGGEILYGAFNNCNKLVKIIISENVMHVNGVAFSGCTNLNFNEYENALYLGDTNNPYYSLIKAKDTSIASCNVNAKTKLLATSSFSYCENLKNVELPDGLIEISGGTFRGCSGITSIKIPDSVKAIGSSAFSYCKNLKNVELPNGLIEISESTFSGCSSLTNISIPDSICSIGGYAFSGCSSLRNITIPNNIMSIGGSVFNECDSINYNIYNNALYIGNIANPYLILIKAKDTTITSCIINSNTKMILGSAFRDCGDLLSIEIPNNVTSIGGSVFYGCNNLTSMTIPFVGSSAFATSLNHETVFGFIFGYTTGLSPASNATYQYYGYDNGASSYYSYYIPKTLTEVKVTGGEILDNSFYNCANLKRIIIPESVKSIGDNAFNGCCDLINIVIPNNVISIGDNAFTNCSGLTSITIGENVNSIGYNAFQYCYKLIEVYNLSTLDIKKGYTSSGYVGGYALDIYTSLDENSKLTETDDGYIFYTADEIVYLIRYIGQQAQLTLPENFNEHEYSIYKYAFYNFSELTNIIIPNSVTGIGSSAFYGCSGLTNIIIPNSVTNIENSVFYGCNGLSTISLPFVGSSKGESRNTYFGYIFGANSYTENSNKVPKSLKTVYITSGETISDRAFYGCSELTSVILDDNITSIGNNAFEKCSSLTNIKLSDSLVLIGSSAFYNCNCITSIIISDSVTTIGSNAFTGCINLETIFYTSTELKWTEIIIDNYNTTLNNISPYYYSEEQPMDDGNYWHYVDGEVVIWAKEV